MDNILVPQIEKDGYFTYLGRHFDFKMTDEQHKVELLNDFNKLMERINFLPLHPRNKLLLYQCVVLSKISWHMTVSNISNTWFKNNVDGIASKYIRIWLEIPISGTLCIVTQSKSKFGLAISLPSTRQVQCRVTFRNSLRKSVNDNIKNVHASTKPNNVQYDCYLTTKDAIKKIRKMDENRLREELTTQSLVIKSIWDFADSSFTNQWTSVLQQLPRNIYSFVNRYLSNTLANATNAVKWGLTKSPMCILCDQNQTLGHVMGACEVALHQKRYNWRHDSVLMNIIKTISSLPATDIFCDIEGFSNPSAITGFTERPDIVVRQREKLFVLELTVGFETNLVKNFERKKKRYEALIKRLSDSFDSVNYVNLSMSAIGIISKNSELVASLSKLGLSREVTNLLIKRIMNVSIRSSYFIFCCRNKAWSDPTLMYW